MATLEPRVTVKLFIGAKVTPELRVHLAQSHLWKEATIVSAAEKGILVQTHFHNNTYIGLYVEEEYLTLPAIHDLQLAIRQQLSNYCPKVHAVNQLPLYIFPQMFVN